MKKYKSTILKKIYPLQTITEIKLKLKKVRLIIFRLLMEENQNYLKARI